MKYRADQAVLWARFYSVGSGITILDPVLGQRFLLDSNLRTARIGVLSPTGRLTVGGSLNVAPAAQAALADRVKAELKAATPTAVITSKDAKAYADNAKAFAETARVYADTIVAGQNGTHIYPGFSHSKYETRTEQLGVQNIEGVEAEGVRTITTIPAGDIGNERPIEMVYEKWCSKDLQLVVLSKHSDPRLANRSIV